MDRQRFEELKRKRHREGLTRQEADELGRLFAEERGEPYGNAEDPPPDVEAKRVARTDVEDVEPAEETAAAGSEEDATEPDVPLGPKGTEPRLTSDDPEAVPESGQGPPPA